MTATAAWLSAWRALGAPRPAPQDAGARAPAARILPLARSGEPFTRIPRATQALTWAPIRLPAGVTMQGPPISPLGPEGLLPPGYSGG